MRAGTLPFPCPSFFYFLIVFAFVYSDPHEMAMLYEGAGVSGVLLLSILRGFDSMELLPLDSVLVMTLRE